MLPFLIAFLAGLVAVPLLGWAFVRLMDWIEPGDEWS